MASTDGKRSICINVFGLKTQFPLQPQAITRAGLLQHRIAELKPTEFGRPLVLVTIDKPVNHQAKLALVVVTGRVVRVDDGVTDGGFHIPGSTSSGCWKV